MRITWKVVYAFLCFLAVFLIPLAYADEDVSVYFYKDGGKIDTPALGDKVMLHSEIVGANSSDHITLTLQDSSLKFSSNPSSQTTDVYGRVAGDNVWIYEAEVEVLAENPVLPKAQYIRDRSQPELENTEKPTSVSIDLNSEQIVSPGDKISAKGVLEPGATVDPAYYNYLEWSVSYGDQTITLDKPRGEAIEFTIPDAALNNSVQVNAVLKGQECGLSADITAEAKTLKVNDESLSVQIFPSTDSEGVLIGNYLGFSSELLRNGKVAEESAREGITYWWTAQIGQQFVNGQKRNSPTYVISPEETGTLTVYLTVTLANGITLESNHVTKTVVNSDSTLESVEIKQLETGEVKPGDTISVTYTLNPGYVTNLNGAKYEWKAVSGDNTIATSDKLEDFSFTAQKTGIVSVTLMITLNEDDPIISNTLDINVVDSTPTKIYSGKITTDQDTKNLKVGDTLNLNAELVTEGGENINYSWKATNKKGETLGESKDTKSFSITPQKAENITVTLLAEVASHSSLDDVDNDGYKAVKLIENYSIKENNSQPATSDSATTDNKNSNQQETPVKENDSSDQNSATVNNNAENNQQQTPVVENASDQSKTTNTNNTGNIQQETPVAENTSNQSQTSANKTGNIQQETPVAENTSPDSNTTVAVNSEQNTTPVISTTENSQNETTNPSNANDEKIIEGKIGGNNQETPNNEIVTTNNSKNNTTNGSKPQTNEVSQPETENKQTEEKTDGEEVKKVKTDVSKELTKSGNNSNKSKTGSTDKTSTANNQTVENTTKQTSQATNSTGTSSNPSTSTTTNNSAGATKTSSSNSSPSNSQQLSPKTNNSPVQNVTNTSGPKGSQSSSTNTSNVFNKSSNIVNPKTGTNFTVGELLVISVCSFLTIVSIILLFRKRRQS